MTSLKILILTDHAGHSSENSVYALARSLATRDIVSRVDIASRSHPENQAFFYEMSSRLLQAHRVENDFYFSEKATQLLSQTKAVELKDYDWVWLRLPRPIPKVFFEFLMAHFPEQRIFNRPSGIMKTSSKAFLLELAEICPPMQLIQNQEDLENFRQRFPIVLKPLLNYGGKGVLRIEDDEVWEDQEKKPYKAWLAGQEKLEYLGMQFLKNVGQGDKRIVVCNGEVLTAVLRYPAKGSWMCNIAQGGHAEKSEVSPAEQRIIDHIQPILHQEGILMYGLDTLMGNEGERLLSEVNTLSIGGIAPSGTAVVEKAIDGILSYIKQQEDENSSN